MCPRAPKIKAAPPPPKRNTDTPDLDVADAADEDLRRQYAAMGIDQLRIERTSPASALPQGGSGLQITR